MSFCERWVEEDYNPFILFDANGKISNVNEAAQFLLGYVTAETIYEYATSYASTNFGFKTTHIALNFERFSFFAITVGYENEDQIGIKLYRMPPENKPLLQADQNNFPVVNIYTLIDLSISTNSIGEHAAFIKEFDPTLPECRINADIFLKTLNAMIEASRGSDSVLIQLKLKTGEYIKIKDKKHAIVTLIVEGTETLDKEKLRLIDQLVERLGSHLSVNGSRATLEFALIT